MSVHSDRSTISYKTRTKALRSGNHGPRARTPRGQVPNLRRPDLGLYKWKPDLQEA